MIKKTTVGITIRLPSILYKELARRAKAEARSINQEANKLLQEALFSRIGLHTLQETKDASQGIMDEIRELRRRLADLETRVEDK
jgi:hypothetical protein